MAQVEKIFENGIQVLGNSAIRDTSFLGLTTTSGTSRTIQAQGSGSNISINLTPKGTGTINLIGPNTGNGIIYSVIGVGSNLAIGRDLMTLGGDGSSYIISGTSQVNGGNVTLKTGDSTGAGIGGGLTLATGTHNQNARTGHIVIQSGNNTDSGTSAAAHSGNIYLNTGTVASASASALEGSIGIFTTTGSFGGGEKVIFINNSLTNPSTSVTGGGVMFIKSSDSRPYWWTGTTEYPMSGGIISGLTINSIPYATSATTIGSDTALTWDPTNKSIGLGNTRLYTVNLTYDSLFWGENAGSFSNTSTGGNVGIGHQSLSAVTSGENNVSIGAFSGGNRTTLSFNVFIGFDAGGPPPGGPYTGNADNIGIGRATLHLMTSNAGGNVCIGKSAGTAITSSSNNTCIGNEAGNNITTGSNILILGSRIGAQSATASDQLSIQNIIFGVNNSGTGTTISTGSIGIGVTTPTRKFEVAGSVAIQAGTSTGQIARVPGIIKTDTTTTGNVTTGEDVLQTYSVLANTLATNGDTLIGSVSGTFTNNANNKILRIRFGSSLIFDVPAFASLITASWVIKFEIIRTSSTTQKCNATVIIEDSVYSEYSIATETLSGAVTLQITGEGTDTNDIVKETFKLRWEPSE